MSGRGAFAHVILLALNLLAVQIWAQDPAGAGNGSPTEEIRVMSFNLRYATAPDGENAWEHRHEILLETIQTFRPDLLGTQECLAQQADYLCAELPEYGFVGVGRDDGELAGEMCAIFFRRGRFKQLAAGHFWLSETPNRIGSISWDSALTRMATWVKLQERDDPNATFYFFNTHFDHRGEIARREAAALLRREAETLSRGLPAVITGDFNAPADPERPGPYHALISGPDDASQPFVDTYRRIHPKPHSDEGTFNGFAGRTDGDRIDWIVVTPSVRVIDAAIVRTNRDGRYPSDHFPVTAVIAIGPSPH